jgi:hypothetical protein
MIASSSQATANTSRDTKLNTASKPLKTMTNGLIGHQKASFSSTPSMFHPSFTCEVKQSLQPNSAEPQTKLASATGEFWPTEQGDGLDGSTTPLALKEVFFAKSNEYGLQNVTRQTFGQRQQRYEI